MLGEIGSLIGAGLGQLRNVFSAPRKVLWGALGLPESGSELMSQTFGKLGGALAKGAEETPAGAKALHHCGGHSE